MLHTKRFPNESTEYREARNKVLQAEIDLRRQIESVAKMRRELPVGGKLKEDYEFDELVDGKVRKVQFSELFAPGKDTLIIYSMMYAPNDEKACPSCTSIIDSVDGAAPHVSDRVNLVIVTKAPIEKTLAWAKSHGWRNARFVSSFSNSYNTDYFAQLSEDKQQPILNVFHKYPDGIHHTYATELMFTPSDPGQNMRHVDSIWPIWNLFDFTPEGRGETWSPKHSYEKK